MIVTTGFLGGSVVKNPPANAGDAAGAAGSIPGLRTSLEKEMVTHSRDRGAWWATVHRVTESDVTQYTHTHLIPMLTKSFIYIYIHTHTHTHTHTYIHIVLIYIIHSIEHLCIKYIFVYLFYLKKKALPRTELLPCPGQLVPKGLSCLPSVYADMTRFHREGL